MLLFMIYAKLHLKSNVIFFLASETQFHVKMFMEYTIGYPENDKYQSK